MKLPFLTFALAATAQADFKATPACMAGGTCACFGVAFFGVWGGEEAFHKNHENDAPKLGNPALGSSAVGSPALGGYLGGQVCTAGFSKQQCCEMAGAAGNVACTTAVFSEPKGLKCLSKEGKCIPFPADTMDHETKDFKETEIICKMWQADGASKCNKVPPAYPKYRCLWANGKCGIADVVPEAVTDEYFCWTCDNPTAGKASCQGECNSPSYAKKCPKGACLSDEARIAVGSSEAAPALSSSEAACDASTQAICESAACGSGTWSSSTNKCSVAGKTFKGPAIFEKALGSSEAAPNLPASCTSPPPTQAKCESTACGGTFTNGHCTWANSNIGTLPFP